MKLALLPSLLSLGSKINFSQTPKKSELVDLNGTTVYYEVYGEGEPLLLLHGYTQSGKYWLPFVQDYANEYEVYVIDLKGHGRSGAFKENLSIKSAAKDLDAILQHLKLKSVNAIGYSYGGDVLFQLTLLRPELVKAMVSIGACGSWDARDFPDWKDIMSFENIDNLPWMRDHQTSEEQIKIILEQFQHYVVSVSNEEMKRITAKTLFILGDKDDSIPLECISNAMKHLPESYLWILPNSGHGAHEGKNKDAFVQLSRQFFKEQWKK
jgi:pimeloyl-ACP methyl ester carboxylesterase